MTVTIVETPFGFAAIAARKGSLVGVSLPLTTRAQALKRLSATITEPLEEGECTIEWLPARIADYYLGNIVDFKDVTLDLSYAGRFETQVLECTRMIPYGCVATYAELAAKIGNPRAARAVGNAMAKNRMPLIIPCHRIVRSDKTSGGFAYGNDLKKQMLQMEKVEI